MTWARISTDSTWERQSSYSRAIYDDEWIFVSGTSGFDYPTMTISEDFTDQAKQMWANVQSALEKAGSGLDEVVSFLLVLKDPADAPKHREVQKQVVPHRPTGMAIVAGFVDDRIKVEIQVTAKRKSTVKPRR
jgi:enamine deaminase RidA (YjgF/YER057c/UK114 family)